MTARTLSLQREALTELTTDELAGVVAAQWTPACPMIIKLSEMLDCHGAAGGR